MHHPGVPLPPDTPPVSPWTYPDERYYESWWGEDSSEHPPPTDGEIKSLVVDQLKKNRHTQDADIQVDVKQGAVILGGEVSSWLAKRTAGDDAWDTPGVSDVSNQLVIPART